jgi:hypothetical protein
MRLRGARAPLTTTMHDLPARRAGPSDADDARLRGAHDPD